MLSTVRPQDCTGIPDLLTSEQDCPTWQHHIVKSRREERKKEIMEKDKGGLAGRGVGLWEIVTGSIKSYVSSQPRLNFHILRFHQIEMA